MIEQGEQAEKRQLFAAIGEALFARGLDPSPENFAFIHALLTGSEESSICAVPEADAKPDQKDATQELMQVARRQAEALASVADAGSIAALALWQDRS